MKSMKMPLEEPRIKSQECATDVSGRCVAPVGAAPKQLSQDDESHCSRSVSLDRCRCVPAGVKMILP